MSLAQFLLRNFGIDTFFSNYDFNCLFTLYVLVLSYKRHLAAILEYTYTKVNFSLLGDEGYEYEVPRMGTENIGKSFMYL